MDIIADTLDELYCKAIDEVLYFGSFQTARGLTFKECIFQHLMLTNPRARILQNPLRNFRKRFMVAEFIWMMSGKCNLDQIEFYNKKMRDFSDDGISLHGAYGPRLRHWSLQHGDVDQLETCLQRLKDDIYTRQAVVVIIDPAIDFTVKTKDIPCNNYLQFLYRDNRLHLMCYVRSNDLLLGFPYDIWHWTMLQEMYASILNVELGNYHHMVGSLHIYDNNIDMMTDLANVKVNHFPMARMPKLNDLSIIDDLSRIEKRYREEGIIDTENIDSYWINLLENLWIK